MGGADENGLTERYDPVRATWTTGSPPTVGLDFRLADVPTSAGLVVATGGCYLPFHLPLPSGSAQWYDASADAWTVVQNARSDRWNHTLTKMDDRKYLEVGGSSAFGYGGFYNALTLDTADVFDPTDGSKTSTARMTTPRAGHAAVRLGDGRVLVSGGASSVSDLATAGFFRPSSQTWTSVDAMEQERVGHRLLLLRNGQVLAVGGAATAPRSVEVFAPPRVPPVITTVSPASGPRIGGTVVTLRGSGFRVGATVTFGGVTAGPVTLRGDTTATLVTPAHAVGAVTVALTNPDGLEAEVVAGFTYQGLQPSMEWATPDVIPYGTPLSSVQLNAVASSAGLLVPGTFEYTPPAGTILPVGRHTVTVTFTPTDTVTYSWASATVVQVVSAPPVPTRWEVGPSLATARSFHSATRLRDGRVLVAGGTDSSGLALSSAEIFDPVTAAWSPATSLAAPWTGHSAVLLPDGRVLVGRGGASGEVYDPATGLWSATALVAGDSREARAGELSNDVYNSRTATLTALSDGRVLARDGAAIYDAGSGGWTRTGRRLATDRYLSVSTPLSDSRVLTAGGWRSWLNLTSSVADAELFDAVAGT